MEEKNQFLRKKRACVRFKIPEATFSYFKYFKKALLPLFKNKSEENFWPLFDINRGGVRFLTREEVPMDNKLEMKIQVPGEPVPLKMKDWVRWFAPYEGKNYQLQVGVQFFSYGEEKGQNYPRNPVKITAPEQKFLKKPVSNEKDKGEFII